VIVDLPVKPLDSFHAERCFHCAGELERGEAIVQTGMRFFHPACKVEWVRQ
jgi:hypothetical protein